jgi:hypothetical protein
MKIKICKDCLEERPKLLKTFYSQGSWVGHIPEPMEKEIVDKKDCQVCSHFVCLECGGEGFAHPDSHFCPGTAHNNYVRYNYPENVRECGICLHDFCLLCGSSYATVEDLGI